MISYKFSNLKNEIETFEANSLDEALHKACIHYYGEDFVDIGRDKNGIYTCTRPTRAGEGNVIGRLYCYND